MLAMVLKTIREMDEATSPLEAVEIDRPDPGPGEVLIRVNACGVCHTELDEIEGRTPPAHLPVIPGHQVVGRVEGFGEAADRFERGRRVGVGWIYSACGRCAHCRSGRENLCPGFRATGRDADGGYAEYMVVPEAYAHPVPDVIPDTSAAPLLCAGAIGYRSLRLAGIGDGDPLGLMGFGASGHLVLKMVRAMYPKTAVSVFARRRETREFARSLGADWAGDTGDRAPEELRAVIDTTPVWRPVLEALENLQPGGRLVINAIRKEDADRDHLLGLSYRDHLWMEREVKSVANVTRRDIGKCLHLAAEARIAPEVTTYGLKGANRVLRELRFGRGRGARVLTIE